MVAYCPAVQRVQSHDMLVAQTPQWQNFGCVTETHFQSDRSFAFIKMDGDENAAMAISQLSGYNVNGRPLKCSSASPGLMAQYSKRMQQYFAMMQQQINPILLRSGLVYNM